ncbi:hypothetical protein [Serratia fonticola]|uniref:hypothetical protein n=1 Tax=Serratia fonticola TaxID=47917 RepID=UPI003AAE35EB
MTISTERLRKIVSGSDFVADVGGKQSETVTEIARELLAVREAQPVASTTKSNIDAVLSGVSTVIWPVRCFKGGIRVDLYTAPPAPAVPGELLDAMAEVIRISDRDHEAWDRAKAAISACQPDGEKCWSCGKYFTYAQHSECDGYCPHCNAPVDLDDEDQPSQVVPVEPTEDMVAKAWRAAFGKCDHETIKRMYATMLAAAPTPTKAVPDA